MVDGSFIFPVAISIAITITLLASLLFAGFFFDFVKDSWKLPFAAAVDIIDFVALFSPGYLDIAAAVGSILVFLLLAKSILKYPGGVVAAGEGFLGMNSAFAPLMAVHVAGLLPINTVLMFIDTTLD
jgi:hypothetical protein